METVILLNPTPRAIDLGGWRIADQQKRKRRCGNASRQRCRHRQAGRTDPAGNSGGIITLLNADGLKVDGVSYTKAQARRERWLVVF